MMRPMCGVQLKDGKSPKELTLTFGLNETIDLSDLANSVLCVGEGGCLLFDNWTEQRLQIRGRK